MSADLSEPTPIRLPITLRQQAEEAARAEGISLQSFILRALTEHTQKTARRHAEREQDPT